MTAQVGDAHVAVMGRCPITATKLSELAAGLRSLADVDRLGARLAGSFHLLVAIGRQVRVQGTVSGLRRISYARVAGVTVAADRADVLAGVAGATVDEERLAAQLVYPWLPHPVSDGCPWQGIRVLPDGCYLLTGVTTPAREVRWWRAPEPAVALAEAAPVVAKELVDAVEARSQGGGTISCDLSGGLDSTPICCLAARGSSQVIAVTVVAADPGQEDGRWARQAAAELPGVEPLRLDAERIPGMYEHVGAAGVGADGPHVTVRDQAAASFIAGRLSALGSRVHLGGMGGDQALHAPLAYLHTTARLHPRIAAAHLRGGRATTGWPLTALLRGLADRRSYEQSLAAAIDGLSSPVPDRSSPELGWTPPLRLPPWATPRAADAARAVLGRAVCDAQPLAPTRGQHATVEQLRDVGHVTRQIGATYARAGLPLDAPFLDDRVLGACLAVRLHERTTPWRYKPLIVEAMRDLVPAAVLQRTTKDHFTAHGHRGLQRARTHLAGLLDDLALARLGLVDVDALRRVCLGMLPFALHPAALDRTLACEAWLRTLDSSALPSRSERPNDLAPAR